MNSVQIFQKLRDYSWDEEAWFLPLAPAIEGVTASQAAWQPPGGGNTIWQTLNHLNYFNALMVKRVQGLSAPTTAETNTETFGDKGDPGDEVGWQKTVEDAKRIAGELKQVFKALTEKELEEKELANKIAAWVMHDAYHTGQIVLIRKMQASWPASRED